jgi:hypothetical protein
MRWIDRQGEVDFKNLIAVIAVGLVVVILV